ncbi:hypothetical protein LLG95_15445 [bacterium]|nr:hypothetical protein [bacterium]
MKTRMAIFSICAAVLMMTAGCASGIKHKTTSDEYHTITRTYWYGIPIYEKSEFNESAFPTDDNKMRDMERELRKSDEKIKMPERGMITP